MRFQDEAVPFLLSLPMVSRINLLQKICFKYRGENHPVTGDHVRDTGYLWNELSKRNKLPELGRIRSWFSVHNALAKAFVEIIPDKPLPVADSWQRYNGLSATDGSWELEFPKSVDQLKYYGRVLDNCVGGYGPAIETGRSVIFVVKEKGIPTHCVEVAEGSFRQFSSARNNAAKERIKTDVISALTYSQN